MKKYPKKIKKITYLLSILLFILVTVAPVEATSDFLTEEEKEYISESRVLKAASVRGAAPLTFEDSKGEVQGISKRLLDEISRTTGLVFDYRLYDSVGELLESDADIIYGISKTYAPEDMPLSKPFLESVTILYMNSSMDSDNLENKIFAAIEGGDLPEGIQEDRAIYFKSRQEAIEAVEKGIADYGYGNAYSLSYYLMLNNYKNIVTVPQEMETRGYSIGLLEGDEILLDILNKAIDSIDETLKQAIILEVSTQVGQRMTLDRILNTYGKYIILAGILIIGILLYNVIFTISAKNKLSIQIKRYEVLSHISNEYFFEYNVKHSRLSLSEKCNEIFGEGEELQSVKRELVNHLSKIESEEDSSIIDLPLLNGKQGVFKVISTRILDITGKADSIIGKLIDVSKDAKEKESLLNRSQIDGLTGVYNAITTKERIIEKLNSKKVMVKGASKDALILIDCDDFKTINDTHGHLMGDKILEALGKILKQTFRSTDIIGRIGGDEFCVYMTDVSSKEDLKSKCEQINLQLRKTDSDIKFTVSIGTALVDTYENYEAVFKKADEALYKAKDKGKARCV